MTTRRIAARATAAIGVAAVALALTAGGGAHGSHGPDRIGPEGVPVPAAPPLAPAGAPAPGRTVDGITSAPLEQVAFHIHAHLTVFVAGAARQIPYGIGIAPPVDVQSTQSGRFAAGGAAFSWLHTHAADGIVHIESPVQREYTLGDFFDVWGQPLSATRVGPAAGPVTAFLNGRRYLGDPRAIQLAAHAQIQLDVGRPLVAPESIVFSHGL